MMLRMEQRNVSLFFFCFDHSKCDGTVTARITARITETHSRDMVAAILQAAQHCDAPSHVMYRHS